MTAGASIGIARRRMAVVWLVMLAFSFVAPSAAAQKPAGEIPTIGFLHPGSFANSKRVPLFLKGLHDLGYVEGRNIRIEWRFADGKSEQLPKLAADLVRRKVSLIVCPGSAAGAAIKATRTIPIVVAVASNFVARGWADSLRRPGGNVTGQSTQALGLAGKQIELLREIVPGLKRVGILGVTGNRGQAEQVAAAKRAARELGVGVSAYLVRGEAELSDVFVRMKAERVGALMVLRHGLLVYLRRKVAALARDARLPSLFGHVLEARAGGLMAYGADTDALYRNVANYVDRILRGADPAELPISQATKFNLTINMKTAAALGITFPRSILLRAETVIE